MREYSSVNFPASDNTICTVWYETPAYSDALKLYNQGVAALDEAYKKRESQEVHEGASTSAVSGVDKGGKARETRGIEFSDIPRGKRSRIS
ncbi:hypothetical protein Tco_0587300, partial [Tanacetum coccineum]